MIRLLPALVVLVLAIAATWYLAQRAPEPPTPLPTPAATATAGASATAVSPVAAVSPSPSHRLAGTVVGDRLYAIIEAPDGSNELYAIDTEVPGIGKLIAVGPDSATFEGSDGRFEMGLVAAPVATPRPTVEDDSADEDLDDGEAAEDDGYPAEDDEYYDDF